jgi:hypothetical protein
VQRGAVSKIYTPESTSTDATKGCVMVGVTLSNDGSTGTHVREVRYCPLQIKINGARFLTLLIQNEVTMELKNVSIYSPDNMPDGHRFLYFKSEDGQDFYESLNLFTKKYKLCIEPDTGIIRSMAKDVSELYPAGFTVVDVDELPDGADISGDWLFDGQKVVRRIPTQGERVAKAKFEKASLMQDATNVIVPLQDAVDLDMATEAEKVQLVAWKKYRVLLNRIDVSTAPDIAWPEAPDSPKPQ